MKNLKIDLVDIPFSDIDTDFYNIRNYFRRGITAKAKIKDNASLEDFMFWHENVVSVPKMVWLAKEYVSNNGFNFPVTASWSAEKNKWFIHPGYFRKTIIEYFSNKDTIECFCSEDHNFKIKRTFTSQEEIKNYYNVPVQIKNAEIHSTNHYETQRMIKWHKHCKDFFTTTKIEANFDLTKFAYSDSLVKAHKKTLKVTASSKIEQYRAIFLMPSFDNFNNYGVTIERT